MMGPFVVRCSLIAVAMMLAYGVVAVAQGPTFNVGRTPTEEERQPVDAAVGPDGQGLPPGRGTAKEGATVFAQRGCAKCHGTAGRGSPGPSLVGANGRGIGSPFAPLIWNSINQMMPLDLMQQYVSMWRFSSSEWPQKTVGPAPCCLSADEVYSLTAYVLHRSGIIEENSVMDADSLPQVRMPNRDAFNPPPFLDSEWKTGLRQAQVIP